MPSTYEWWFLLLRAVRTAPPNPNARPIEATYVLNPFMALSPETGGSGADGFSVIVSVLYFGAVCYLDAWRSRDAIGIDELGEVRLNPEIYARLVAIFCKYLPPS